MLINELTTVIRLRGSPIIRSLDVPEPLGVLGEVGASDELECKENLRALRGPDEPDTLDGPWLPAR
jgi:hypothetical protein